MRRATEVKALIESGMRPHDVAAKLNVQPKSTMRLYHCWYAHHGLPVSEAFQRLSWKSAAAQSLPVYQRIAGEVQRLADQGWPLQDIASHCQVDRNTVTASMNYLAKQRGERPLDGRARRKMLRIEREKRNGEERKGS